jgi:hypothetical protein
MMISQNLSLVSFSLLLLLASEFILRRTQGLLTQVASYGEWDKCVCPNNRLGMNSQSHNKSRLKPTMFFCIYGNIK